MSQQPTTQSADISDIESEDLLLAESRPISDLTGFFRKTMIVAATRKGLWFQEAMS